MLPCTDNTQSIVERLVALLSRAWPTLEGGQLATRAVLLCIDAVLRVERGANFEALASSSALVTALSNILTARFVRRHCCHCRMVPHARPPCARSVEAAAPLRAVSLRVITALAARGRSAALIASRDLLDAVLRVLERDEQARARAAHLLAAMTAPPAAFGAADCAAAGAAAAPTSVREVVQAVVDAGAVPALIGCLAHFKRHDRLLANFYSFAGPVFNFSLVQDALVALGNIIRAGQGDARGASNAFLDRFTPNEVDAVEALMEVVIKEIRRDHLHSWRLNPAAVPVEAAMRDLVAGMDNMHRAALARAAGAHEAASPGASRAASGTMERADVPVVLSEKVVAQCDRVLRTWHAALDEAERARQALRAAGAGASARMALDEAGPGTYSVKLFPAWDGGVDVRVSQGVPDAATWVELQSHCSRKFGRSCMVQVQDEAGTMITVDSQVRSRPALRAYRHTTAPSRWRLPARTLAHARIAQRVLAAALRRMRHAGKNVLDLRLIPTPASVAAPTPCTLPPRAMALHNLRSQGVRLAAHQVDRCARVPACVPCAPSSPHARPRQCPASTTSS